MRVPRILALIALPALAACSSEPEPQLAMNTPAAEAAAVAAQDTLVVYKDPNCGCCAKWVEHAKENGFAVVEHNTADMAPVKQRYGVPADQVSCHTAVVGGYTIEGHVPADLIRKMLDEKATFRGLAVGGMPMGSPGMEGLIKQDYDVVAFDSAGNQTVYARR